MPYALNNSSGAQSGSPFGGGLGTGGAANLLGLANTALGFAGPVGSVVSSVVGALGGLLGGGATTDWATGRFEGYHSGTLPRLDDSTIRNGDADVYLRYAKQYGHSVEAVKALMEQDMRVSKNTWAYVFDAWRMPTWSGYQSHIDLMQRVNPSFDFWPARGGASQVPSGVLQLTPPTNSGLGLVPFGNIIQPPPTNTQNLTGKEILGGAWDGAVAGVTDLFLKTPEGQAATNQGAVQFLKDKWYIPVAIVATLAGLIGAVISLAGKKK